MSNMSNKEMVRLRRLELPRVINPQRPQRCASTNSATAAPKGPGLASDTGPMAWRAPCVGLYPISPRFNQVLFRATPPK